MEFYNNTNLGLMLVYFRLLSESFNFAMNALRNNKLRTLLSLLGVTIGIFSIIAVLAAPPAVRSLLYKEKVLKNLGLLCECLRLRTHTVEQTKQVKSQRT